VNTTTRRLLGNRASSLQTDRRPHLNRLGVVLGAAAGTDVAEHDMADASEVLAGPGFRLLGELGIPLRWAMARIGRALVGCERRRVSGQADVTCS
jgi:hypothetical protein